MPGSTVLTDSSNIGLGSHQGPLHSIADRVFSFGETLDDMLKLFSTYIDLSINVFNNVKCVRWMIRPS
ncbi:MAG: hypothetical protein QXI36_05230 [Candidatus Bathyarchaeia archaeon]